MSSTGNGRTRGTPTALTGTVAVTAAVITVAVVALPFVRFAYHAPALHVVLETANALVALFVGYLVYGRYAQNRKLQDLLLVLALGAVAIANLVLMALPSAVTMTGDDEFSAWAAVAIRLLGTLVLTAAALSSPRVRIGRKRAAYLALTLAGVVVAVGAAGLGWGNELPQAVDPAARLGDATVPRLVAHPLVLATQALGAVLYAVAAFAFTRQAERTGDELLRWVGAGCVLASFARVHYLLFPSLYSEYVYTGDLFRLGFYVCLLVGAAREIRSFWELRTRTAVLEDRRRMARDLHDGLAQELAYLWSQTRSIANQPPDEATVERIGGAAGRALDEARRAIAALTRPIDEPFGRVLQQVADDLGSRYDVKVVTTVEPDLDLDATLGETLVRITAEAVRNAVRHGGARQIDLSLTTRPLRLTITDDGTGFTVGSEAGTRGGGFGLTSMSERARSIGAGFEITSTPGQGTTVLVTR
jgi:signal transduction histidine kinase